MTWAAILALGLVSGTLSGIVGFGASIMLMPVLMLAFGPLEAVPIMAIAALLANFSRVVVWWREVDWRANAYYCATAIPAAALGARTLLILDPRLVEGILGAMFLAHDPGAALAAGARPAHRGLAPGAGGRRHRLPLRHGRLDGADQHAVLPGLRPGQGRLSLHRGAGLDGDRHHQGDRVPALQCAAAGRRWHAASSSAPR